MGARALTYEDLDGPALARLLGVPSCEIWETVTSTLDVAHARAAEGAPHGTLVLAEEQTHGRGRLSRRWVSPRGCGLWLAYLARPSRDAPSGVIALRVGLAVGGALRALGLEPQLKWPNDVVLCDRKAGGILCEARWKGVRLGWLAIGIGLNVRGPLPPTLPEHAIALDAVRPGITRLAVLRELVPRLEALSYADTLTADECSTFEAWDWLRNRQLAEPPGVARGIDRSGALIVETPHGVARLRGGSVVVA